MARNPALEMAGPKGYRQRTWEEIRLRGLHGDTFSMLEIALELDVETLLLRDYFTGLIAAGFIGKIAAARNGAAARYTLLRDNGAEAPRLKRDGSPLVKGLAEEQMWRVLRSPAGSDIGIVELAAYASTPEVTVSPSEAGAYLLQLACAKYLTQLPYRRGKAADPMAARYRLVSNTGPKPPMFARIDSLYDPNLAALIWIQPVTEETCLYGN